MSDLSTGALALISALNAITIAFIMWKMARWAPVEREQNQSFLLGVLRECLAEDRADAANAEAIRGFNEIDQANLEVAAMQDGANGRDAYYSEEMAAVDLAEKMGFNLNDPDQMEQWRSRWGHDG